MSFSEAFSWINIQFLLEGLLITVEVAFYSIVFSIILGFILGVIRYFDIPVVSKVVGWVVDIIRNLPLLLIIFFTYFALPELGLSLDVFWSTVTAMTIFEASMISEILRGGLKAVPKGQTEAGFASGLTRLEVMRYILLPQAVRDTLPSVVSQLIALIKDTSLATIITLPELTHNAQIIYGQNTSYVIPMFAALAFFYFVICFALSLFSKYLARTIAIRAKEL
ncbi:MAG TPA: amino acid ABC transporter permease [Candidatus Atopostipes pullistercoris]|uniref:Amino acid ABC transporter permease n=1 Tax=Candidatus Atopostipes pullistercoris TaxID=2838467 RepID=A0A9D2JWZ2_9LACT|nr:amino acid ABC transporter permease [Candidatus Atopostipes pullistercoris]